MTAPRRAAFVSTDEALLDGIRELPAEPLFRVDGCPDMSALADSQSLRPAAASARPAGEASPRILGLDLSIAAPGFAGVDGATHSLKLDAKRGDSRLNTIADEAVRLSARAHLVVIEDLPTHAHGAGITGMVHGAVRAALLYALVPYVLVPPASLKKFSTGRGNADKTAMALAAFKRFGREFADDNQCDAAWLRWMGLAAYGALSVELPAAQTEALGKVAWPKLGGAS